MESLLIKEFVAKEQEGYKLRIRVSKILSPKDLRCVDFIGEQYNNGKMVDSSTYTFFLTDGEIASLCEGLHP
jgi:hypothetical protein